MRDDDNRGTRAVILVLVFLVVVLLGVIAYILWLKPTYQEFVLDKQREAYNAGLADGQVSFFNTIATQIQQTGYVQIPLSENQTLYLTPFNPQSAPAT